MIGAEFHKGQGLGNQLWVYAVVRAIALRHGYTYDFSGTKNFKGNAFLNLSFTTDPSSKFPNSRKSFQNFYKERTLRHPENNADISPWDQALHNISDETFLEGTMQSEKYLNGFKPQILDWFQVPGKYFDGCVISLRGGEYRNIGDVFLPKSYYDNAIAEVQKTEPNVKFLVVTDDASLAREYFPNFPILSSGGVKRVWKWYRHPSSEKIGMDFSALQHAKYLILSNSSFSWWGAYSNTVVKRVIAPKFWARFNTSDGYWSTGDSLTSGWDWLDRDGIISTYEQCSVELESFRQKAF